MTTEMTLHRPASSELALSEAQAEWTDKQKYALGLGPNVSGADLAIYFHVCKRTGLDPFARQIYMLERWTKDGPKQTIQTGIDGYRLIAKRAAGRDGYGYGETQWCGADGQWHDVWLSVEPPSAAKVTVLWRGNTYPAVALYSEYVQTIKSGDPNAMWKRMPANQLAKCAEALALRKAFPQDLSGIYTEDEMGQASNPEPRETTAARVTAADFTQQRRYDQCDETCTTDCGHCKGAGKPVDAEVVEEHVEQERADTQPAEAMTGGKDFSPERNRLNAMFAEFGKRDDLAAREARLNYCSNVLGREVASSKDLKAGDVERVINALKVDTAERDAGAAPVEPGLFEGEQA